MTHTAELTCRWDRATQTHLAGDHPCPATHCRTRTRCTSHLGHSEHTCPTCLHKIRRALNTVVELVTLMPTVAITTGTNSEAMNIAGPHADYVTASWRLINADRAGQPVDELDLRDPYTCLTMHERTIREHLGHDDTTLVSATLTGAAGYLDWVLTDLARDPDAQPLLVALLGDVRRLETHLEAIRANSHRAEKGAPCPACVEAGAPAERLVRHYAHFCVHPDCTREHVTDESRDWWACPTSPEHWWSHEVYQDWMNARAAHTEGTPA